ncbi:GFA family protein [Bacterioplanoides pacificum]|uniref:GFA family protein n=1 Tax=Bacterioplanoides pacificum TaxID=1171596 RepID=A0ABV7VPV1_9GAMM
MPAANYHSGSCLCGAVAFEIHGCFEQFYLCHCQHCRKDTGSAHAANLFSTTARLSWLKGEELYRVYTLPGSAHSKQFCINCGSALPGLQLDGRLLVVPAGSLDTPLRQTADAHLFMQSRAEWDNQLEQAEKKARLP